MFEEVFGAVTELQALSAPLSASLLGVAPRVARALSFASTGVEKDFEGLL